MCSVADSRRVRVFVVADRTAPVGGVALIVDLEHGDVGHQALGVRAVPMLFAGLEEDAVAWADQLDRPAAALAYADTLEYPDRLTVRMRVPGGTGTGREVDAARAHPRATSRRRHR